MKTQNNQPTNHHCTGSIFPVAITAEGIFSVIACTHPLEDKMKKRNGNNVNHHVEGDTKSEQKWKNENILVQWPLPRCSRRRRRSFRMLANVHSNLSFEYLHTEYPPAPPLVVIQKQLQQQK